MPLHVRSGLLAAGIVAGAALPGCRSYEPRPLELDVYRDLLAARGPEADVVAQAAQSLGSGRTPAEPFDLADGLQAHEAEVVALVFNPRLRRLRAEAAVTAAAAQNAGKWDDPVLGVGLEHILSGAHPNIYSGTIGLTLPVSGRLAAEKERLGAEHEARLTEIAAEEWAVRQAVRRGWARWTAATLAESATAAYLADLDTLRSGIDALERAGEISRIEGGAFTLERLAATRRLDTARYESQLRDLELRRLLGLAPEAALSLRPGFPAADAGSESPELVRSPRVLVAAAHYEAAERSLAEQVRIQYPDIEIGPGYKREDGADRILLGLNLPIPLWNRNARGVAEAEAAREAARVAAETALEEVLQDFAAAHARHESAALRLRGVETELVPLAKRQREDALALARRGELDTLLLLEVFRGGHETALTLVETRLEECLAAIDLVELAGPPAPPADAIAPSAQTDGDNHR